jgi:glucose-1-phosphate adenylyltransferase
MGKKIVALILAGGKGTRLESLTKTNAKPAVGFGGKYRIIDYPLSNIANSGIDTVGILIQYESVLLNNYIGNGEKWGLNGIGSLTSILAPRQTEVGSSWYLGTADAIYQNLDFLDLLDPEYVLILSGDHIYKTTYNKMLETHISKGADCTILTIDVPFEEAHRFGIIQVDHQDQVTAFIEKPLDPPTTLASMGIYIFTYPILKKLLTKDAKNNLSSHDFGKDVIPYLLKNDGKIVVERFHGYWRDVGTLESLLKANLDLIDCQHEILRDERLKVYSEDTKSVPQYVGKNAKLKNSLVNQGAIILGTVEHSVIFNEVFIDEGARVVDSVIMSGARIEKGATVYRSIVGPEAVVKKDTMIGQKEGEVTLHTSKT